MTSLVLHNGHNGINNPDGHTVRFNPNTQPVPNISTTSKPVGNTPYEQANNHIGGVNKVFAEYVAEPVGSEAEAHARVAAFQRTEAFREIDAHVAAVDANVQALEARREAVRASLTPDLDAAGESRQVRAFNRHKAVWDTKAEGQLANTVRQSILGAPDAEKPVLIQEAGAYLESRGVPSGFIESTVAEVSPELAAVEREIKAARVERTKVVYNANTVKNAVAAGRPATTVVGIH
jgi:hypothetical protein